MSDYPIRTEQQVSLLLKSLRKARGMTQADLAHPLGVTQQTAADLARNVSMASVSRLLRVLSALGVELVLRDTQAVAKDTTNRQTVPGSRTQPGKLTPADGAKIRLEKSFIRV